MGDHLISSLSTVALGLVGLAIIAVLVSKNADTSNVAGAIGSAFGGVISAADGPVSGSQFGSVGYH